MAPRVYEYAVRYTDANTYQTIMLSYNKISVDMILIGSLVHVWFGENIR